MRLIWRDNAWGCLVAGFILVSASTPAMASASSALEAVDQHVLDNRAQGVAHYIMGVSYDFSGRLEDAAAEYEASARLGVDAYQVHLRLGATFARMGLYPQAVAELKRAAEQNPRNLESRFFLALIYSAQKDFDSALHEYEAIMNGLPASDPRNAQVFFYLGQLYFSQNRATEAVEQFKKALALSPKDVDVMYLLGAYYLEVGRTGEAEKYFRDCIGVLPEHDACLNSLSYLLAVEQRNLDEARGYAEQALRLEPDNAAYLDTLGWVFYQQGRYPEALKELSKAVLMIKDAVVYDHMADTYFKLGEAESARKFWRMSLEEDRDQPKVREKLAALDQALSAEGPRK